MNLSRHSPKKQPVFDKVHDEVRDKVPRMFPARTGMSALRCAVKTSLFLAAASILATPIKTTAQEALRHSMAGAAAAESRRLNLESRAYTFKAGDFRLLASTSLGLDYSDNVRLRQATQEDDFIIRPGLSLSGSYPLTTRNLLSLNVAGGYMKYIDHNDLSRWFVQSGSEIAFDIFIRDFWINLHNRFAFTQQAAEEPAIAGTGNYGRFQNTAGISATWDLRDLTLSAGYDHLNAISIGGQFQQTDRTSELFVSRAGFRLNPALTAGIEGTATLTSYEQRLLNDSFGYSAGVYGQWHAGRAFSVQPRAGYTAYSFDQTSRVVPAVDQDAWYADLTIAHRPTEFVSYSISAGRELRLGIQTDAIESYYVRPSATWHLFKHVGLNTSLSYEHGSQSGGRLGGFSEETYDHFSGGLGLSYSPIRNLRTSLSYRIIVRTSDVALRDYTKNLVSLMLAYTFQ
jgi:hypothetical protein